MLSVSTAGLMQGYVYQRPGVPPPASTPLEHSAAPLTSPRMDLLNVVKDSPQCRWRFRTTHDTQTPGISGAL